MYTRPLISSFFFFNDTATTEIYTLSLHDALPISGSGGEVMVKLKLAEALEGKKIILLPLSGSGIDIKTTDIDRKSTRLNSSHLGISYAVFCLKKKKKNR